MLISSFCVLLAKLMLSCHHGLEFVALQAVFRKHNDSRSLNIYFAPTDEPAATNNNALPYVDSTSSSCVIEDGREPVEIILPHAIGRLLGCPLQASNRAHLMFWDAVMRRTGNFIPKACAGTIHGQAS